jgi:hypothetical protein
MIRMCIGSPSLSDWKAIDDGQFIVNQLYMPAVTQIDNDLYPL